MIVLILPSGHQTFVTREGAYRVCSAETSQVTRISRSEIVVKDREYGDTCKLVTAAFGGYDLRQFARDYGIKVA